MKRIFFAIFSVLFSCVTIAQDINSCEKICETDSALFVVKCKDKFGIYDDSNQSFFVKPQFESIDCSHYAEEGYLRVKKNGKHGMIDAFGGSFIKIEFDSIGRLYAHNDGFTIFRQKNLFGLLGESGNVYFKAKYDSIGTFDNHYGSGRAIVKLNGKYGLISSEGYEYLKPEYDFIERESAFFEMCIRIKRNNLWGIIPIEGPSLPAEYDEIRKPGEVHPNMSVVIKSGKQGLITSFLEVVTKPQFDSIEPFGKLHEEIAIVHSGNFIGAINLEGQTVILPEYDSITKIGDNLFELKKGNTITKVDTWGIPGEE